MDATFLADTGLGILSVDNVLVLIASATVWVAMRVASAWRSSLEQKDVQTERERLLIEVLGPRRTRAGALDGDPPMPLDDEGASADEEPDAKFAKLLIEYYAYGLTQARRSFSVSLSCSTLGGLVLIAGVTLAIFRANTTGQQYASITASVSGLLTTAIGTLFHRRADAALKHMETQSQSLRQDMKVERDAGQAVQLLQDVDDPNLKAHLQAALILKFSAAELPQLDGVLNPVAPLPQLHVNGGVPQQQREAPAS